MKLVKVLGLAIAAQILVSIVAKPIGVTDYFLGWLQALTYGSVFMWFGFDDYLQMGKIEAYRDILELMDNSRGKILSYDVVAYVKKRLEELQDNDSTK